MTPKTSIISNQETTSKLVRNYPEEMNSLVKLMVTFRHFRNHNVAFNCSITYLSAIVEHRLVITSIFSQSTMQQMNEQAARREEDSVEMQIESKKQRVAFLFKLNALGEEEP